MKSVKLTFLVIFLISSFVVISKPALSGQSVEKAQLKLYHDFKSNLLKWHVVEGVDTQEPVELIIYCTINGCNEVEINNIVSDNKKIERKVIKIMKQYPIKASKVLKNEDLAFKLRFERI